MHDLEPTHSGHPRDGIEAVGDVGELDAVGGAEVAGPLEVLGHYVADASDHAHAAMLDLHAAAPVELLGVTVGAVASRVPEPCGRLHAQLVLEGTRAQPHLRTSRADGSVLEHEAHNRYHRQASVRNLGVKLLLADLGVLDGRSTGDAERAELVARVVDAARNALVPDLRQGDHEARAQLPWQLGGVLVGCKQLHGQAEEHDLEPTHSGHPRDGIEAVGDVGELDAVGRAEVAGPLEVLWHDVANAGDHADSPVLNLHAAAAVELLRVPVRAVPSWVPEAGRGLNAQLVLEGLQR